MNLDLKKADKNIFELYQKASNNENSKSVMFDVYNDFIVEEFKKITNCKNEFSVPKLLKVNVNVGFGVENKKDVDYISHCLQSITGQLPKLNKARKSVSNFKIREGDPIGMMVTMRSHKMYYFLEKLLFINMPRVPNFSGFSSKSFDGNGNFSFGFPKHSIFSEEIKNSRVDFDFGMDITIVTSAKNDADAKLLLSLFGFVFI
jgi:large subunit ribosomal protein L5